MVQSPGALESSRHCRVAEPSGLSTTKSTPVWLVSAAGPLWIDGAAGAVRSSVQVNGPSLVLALPASSTLRTSSACEPSPATTRCSGDGQAVQSPGALESRRHCRVAELSGLSTTKSTPVWLVSAAGPLWIDGACGAVVSTVHVEESG